MRMPRNLTREERKSNRLGEQAKALQRPLGDGSLQIVARGAKQDGPAEMFPAVKPPQQGDLF